MIDLFCCSIECDAPVAYEIRTVRGSGFNAGPDPYSDNTHACEQHVGALLGYQPDAINVDEIYWTVRPIGQIS